MYQPIAITKLDDAMIDRAAGLLFHAFQTDPIMLWLFGDPMTYNKRALNIFKLWVKWSVYYGYAICTDDMHGLALWKKPNDHQLSFLSLLRSGLISAHRVLGPDVFSRIKSLNYLLKTEQYRQMGSENFWYCWMVATDPAFRGQHNASALMNEVHQLAEVAGLSCYLEATTDHAVSFYQGSGYQVVSTITVPDSDVCLFAMRR